MSSDVTGWKEEVIQNTIPVYKQITHSKSI